MLIQDTGLGGSVVISRCLDRLDVALGAGAALTTYVTGRCSHSGRYDSSRVIASENDEVL